MNNNLILITGSSNPPLAQKVAKQLKTKVHNVITKFGDGEIKVVIPVLLRKKHVFIIQSTSSPTNDNLMELLLMIDAAKRGDAQEVTAIIPYFGYSRQDRKDRPRAPVSSALIGRLLESLKVNRILTIDIHSEQQQGFFYGPWDNLYGSFVLIPKIKSLKIKNLVVASPDKGGVARAVAYADRLDAQGLAIVYKERDVNRINHSEALDMIGDVRGKNVLIVDDMIDSGGTIINAAKLILQRGARNIYVAATHGIFSGQATQRLSDSEIKQILITDTIAQDGKISQNSKCRVVSISKLLAEAIRRIYTGKSLSEALIN